MFSNKQHQLFSAIENGDVALVQAYLHNKQAINITDHYNETPLITAVRYKQESIVDILLTQPAIDMHIQGYISGTALTYAVFSEQTSIAQKLLLHEQSTIKQIADTNEMFINELHPGAINWAIINNSHEILRLMHKLGANFECFGLNGYHDTPDWPWRPTPGPANSPFHFTYFPELNFTPICLAIEDSNIDMVEFLIKEVKVDLEQRNYDGRTPLEVASDKNYINPTDQTITIIVNQINDQIQISTNVTDSLRC